MTPLAIDLFCGLGGWADGLLAEGYRVVGFDNERHVYGSAHYPAQLVIQDVLTLHGAQFKDAALIVASPPCQEFSYMAMPWTRAKAKMARLQSGEDDPKRLTALFDACFRIQREAIEAAGHHIPLVVENVCGAQKWVGRARWHFGSFYLWGDVPALVLGILAVRATKTVGHVNKRDGYAHTRHLTNQAESDLVRRDGIKHGGDCFNDPTWHGKQGGTKQPGIGGTRKNGKGNGWFQNGAAQHGSKSPARKAASAHMAKIPEALARHIARAWKPNGGPWTPTCIEGC